MGPPMTPFGPPPLMLTPGSVTPRTPFKTSTPKYSPGAPQTLHASWNVSPTTPLGTSTTRYSAGTAQTLHAPWSASPRTPLLTPPRRYSPGSASPRTPLGTSTTRYSAGTPQTFHTAWSALPRTPLGTSTTRWNIDRTPSKYEVVRDMVGDWKEGDFDPERDQHDQKYEWPVPKKTYDAGLQLFYRAVGQTDKFNRTTAVTEENPLGTPNMVHDITRNDLFERRYRRQFLRQDANDQAAVKEMQKSFRESVKPDEESN